MTSLADITRADVRELLGNKTSSRTLINCQNSTATMDAVTDPDTTIKYFIDGGGCVLADFSNKALATVDELQTPITGQSTYYQQPINTTVFYVVVVKADGTVYTIQGTYKGQIISLNGGQSSVRGTGFIPDIAVKSKYAAIAVLKVVNGATGPFIPATTNWDATNVVSSAAPVAVLPSDLTGASLTFVAGGA